MEKKEKTNKFLFEKRIGNKNYKHTGNHYHNYFEIYYMKKGSCCYFIDNKIYNVATHDIIVIPNGVIHNATYQDYDYERLLLQFDNEFINTELFSMLQNLLKQHIYRPGNYKEIEEILDKIEFEYKKNDMVSEELIKCHLTELFSYIIRNESCYMTNDEQNNNLVIEDIIIYINKNFSSQLTLDTMSEKTGFSKFYFSKFFKKSTGLGYKEYLLMIRMKEAKKLLSSTNETISNIAFLCGFNDSNYFSTIFKKTNSISPNTYRKKYRS